MNLAKIRRVIQRPLLCGPATLEMLFSFFGMEITQDMIAAAIGCEEIERGDGTSIDQLDAAVRVLAPDYILLAKYDATLSDLALIVEGLGLPTGVEWQGCFISPHGGCFDIGHFSVVVAINLGRDEILIFDSDAMSAVPDGKFSVHNFEERWWEINDFPLEDDPTWTEIFRHDRLLFVLVPRARADEMTAVGLQPISLSLVYAHGHRMAA